MTQLPMNLQARFSRQNQEQLSFVHEGQILQSQRINFQITTFLTLIYSSQGKTSQKHNKKR